MVCVLCLLFLWTAPDGWNLHKASLRAYRWLQGWLPVTVWQVYGPIGGGPWFTNVYDAAEFIRIESAHDNGYVNVDDAETSCVAIIFPVNELTDLEQRKISFAEWYGWRIERTTILRRDLEREWGGW
jgi:hypothetical protein